MAAEEKRDPDHDSAEQPPAPLDPEEAHRERADPDPDAAVPQDEPLKDHGDALTG